MHNFIVNNAFFYRFIYNKCKCMAFFDINCKKTSKIS